MLRTLFFHLCFRSLTVLLLLVAVPMSFLWRPAMCGFARLWSLAALRLGGVRLTVEGREQLPADNALIFMANHQSKFDIPVLIHLLPHRFGFLAKVELFRIPLLRRAMLQLGCIAIDRGNRQRALASMKLAGKHIRAGHGVTLFPEGTRSVDGRLQPFKKGGFMLALEAGVPIVPIAIHGTHAVMPKHRLRVRAGEVRVRFLPAIPTAGLTAADRDGLMARVHSAIAAALTEMAAT